MSQASGERRSDEWLEQKYEDEDLSVREIASECGVPWNRARSWLAEAGIEVNGNNTEAFEALQTVARRGEPLDDPEHLYEMYEQRGMTQQEIADHHDVAQTTVSYYLRKHDFETMRDMPEALDDPELMRRLYVVDGFTSEDIAARYNVSNGTVLRRLEEHGIPADSPGGSEIKDERLTDRDWLAERLHAEGLSESQIAQECDCEPGIVRHWRRKLLV